MLPADRQRDVDRLIDANLKRIFDETLEEDVPDKFRILLEKLKAQQSSPQKDRDDEDA